MNWLSLDFKKTFVELSPSFFTDERFEAFNSAFAKPLQVLADKTLYEMQHDSRVIYLEKMLNEYFEVATYNPNSHIATRQIYIVDTPQVPKTYIYQPEENQPLYLGEVYLDRDNVTTADFIVKIPIAIEFDEPRLRAVIDFYKLAGKKYIIETY
jgi:hypothetical protein